MKHSEINELLPWYANATLREEERQIVEGHLANCRECTRELETLSMMQQAIVDINNAVKPSARLTFERALDKVEEYETAKPGTDRANVRASLRDWIGNFFSGWWTSTPLLPRAIIAVQALLLIGLAGSIFYGQHKEKIYTTSSASSGDRSNTRIVVSFDANASEQQMRQAISAVHGKIINGPSALDLYTIQVPIPPERSAEIQQVLKTLQQNGRVIRFAEQQP